MPHSKKILGQLIREARQEISSKIGKKFTQQDLATAVGKSRSYIGDLETGRTYPSYALLSKIAQACNVSLGYFDAENYGGTIKNLRESKNITVEEMAKLTDITIEELRLLEADQETELSLKELEKIGEILGLTEDDIFQFRVADITYKSVFRNNGENEKMNVIKKSLLDESNCMYDNEDEEWHKLKPLNELIPIEPYSLINLPIIGNIVAGKPITAIKEEGKYMCFDTKLARIDNRNIQDYFYLRINGDSMEPNLRDGDIALIRKQTTVDNGQIAVVLCNKEDATCKRIVIAGEKIILNSDNPKYTPMVYNNNQCWIIGRVIWHGRKDY